MDLEFFHERVKISRSTNGNMLIYDLICELYDWQEKECAEDLAGGMSTAEAVRRYSALPAGGVMCSSSGLFSSATAMVIYVCSVLLFAGLCIRAASMCTSKWIQRVDC